MARGDWMDFCDVCKSRVPRKSLSYRKFKWANPPRQNYLTASEYNATNWNSDVYDGLTSLGLHPRGRYSIFDDSTSPHGSTIKSGAPTFTGTGYARTLDAVDVSGWSSLVFSVFIGLQEWSTTGSRTFTLGYCAASDGSGEVTLKTVTGMGGTRRLWFTVPIYSVTVDPTDFGLIIRQSTDGYWWFEHAQLEKDVTTPGNVVEQTVHQTTEQTGEMLVKACPKCREVIPDDDDENPYVQEPERYDVIGVE